MNKYTFEINNPSTVDLFISVAADSPEEAVEVANEGLEEAEQDALDDLPGHAAICLSSSIENACVVINTRFRVTEADIVEQSVIDDEELRSAYDFLTGRGYSYDGDLQKLNSDDEPTFNKTIRHSFTSEVSASFEVSALFDHNFERYGYHIEALLTPPFSSSSREETTLDYAVRISDRQEHICFDDLPHLLDLYEEKFIKMLGALIEVNFAAGCVSQTGQTIG